VQKDVHHFSLRPSAMRGWAIATLTLAVAPRIVSSVITEGAHVTILLVFAARTRWRRCRCRCRCRLRWSWSRRRCGSRRSGWCRGRRSRGWCPAALHPNVYAIYELLPPVVTHGLSRIAARMAGIISVEATGAPPSRHQLVPVAAVVFGWHATVRSPPAPLESALCTRQIGGDAVAEFVDSAFALRRQIKAFWMEFIHWLAVCAGIIGTAIGGRSHSLQEPLTQTSIRVGHGTIDSAVANAHLQVTEVVRCDHMLELHYLAGRVGC